MWRRETMIKCLTDGSSSLSLVISNDICKAQRLFSVFRDCRFVSIPRSANSLAYDLARWAASSTFDGSLPPSHGLFLNYLWCTLVLILLDWGCCFFAFVSCFCCWYVELHSWVIKFLIMRKKKVPSPPQCSKIIA